MNRREFITLIGGAAAAWPLAARAQQPMPLVGFLSSVSPEPFLLGAIHRGLAQLGYVERRNLAIEYRWAEDHYERLPALAAGLVDLRVDLIIAAGGVLAAKAAKDATTTIPIVFSNGSDPVRFGLVTSINRPGGNVTGVTQFSNEITPKRLGLLHEIVPKAGTVGTLINPNNPNAESDVADVQAGAATLGLTVEVLRARTEQELEGVLASFAKRAGGVLLVNADASFNSWRRRLISLAARHAVPAMYPSREFAEEGGFISYGIDRLEAHRLAGTYAGRILKGERPADLPVQSPTKFDLVINLKAAKALGIDIPPMLLARADEVIE